MDDTPWLLDEDESDADAAPSAPPWRVLIVDDDEDVHAVTRLSLKELSFRGRRLEFLDAYSAQQGSSIMRHEPDIALVLLDVVMETSDAGLRLVRHIREDLGNRLVQVVLRTGQPGDAPERRVIVDYEINDYKSKSELTGTQIYTVVVAALRAYEGLLQAQRSHDALIASQGKVEDLERALDQHSIISVTDHYGRFTHVNAHFCAISQFAAGELIGYDHRLVNSGFHPPEFFSAMWHTIAEGRVWKGEVRNQAKDGSFYWNALTIVPTRPAGGKHYHYIAIGTDITERMRGEQALRVTEARWKYALDGAGDGVWDVDFSTGDVHFSERWKQMNGYQGREVGVRLDDWRALIHPDDQAQVEADMRAYFAGKTSSYVNEHRSRCQDGSWKWVLDRGMVVSRSATGRPVRMVGTHTDISARKQELERLGAATRQWQALLEQAPAAVFVVDHGDGGIAFANAACRARYGEAALREAAQAVPRLAPGDGAQPCRLALSCEAPRMCTLSCAPAQFDGRAATVAWLID